MTTTRKLIIAIDEKWSSHPRIVALREAGHEICSIRRRESPDYDIYLSESAWHWHDGMWGYLDVALKEARKIKYAKKSDEGEKPKVSRKPRKAKHGDGASGVSSV